MLGLIDTASEFSAMTCIPTRTVRRWCADGTIKAKRIGGKWHIGRTEMERVLSEDFMASSLSARRSRKQRFASQHRAKYYRMYSADGFGLWSDESCATFVEDVVYDAPQDFIDRFTAWAVALEDYTLVRSKEEIDEHNRVGRQLAQELRAYLPPPVKLFFVYKPYHNEKFGDSRTEVF